MSSYLHILENQEQIIGLNWHISASVDPTGDNHHFAINNNVPLSWKARPLRGSTYRKHRSAWPGRSANVSALYLKTQASCARSCRTFFQCCATLERCCHSGWMMMSMQRHWNSPPSPPPALPNTPPTPRHPPASPFFNGNRRISVMENPVQSARPE